MGDIDRFVIHANIEKFQNLLKTERNPRTRDTLLRLLTDAEEDLKMLDRTEKGTSWHHCIATFISLAATIAQAA